VVALRLELPAVHGLAPQLTCSVTVAPAMPVPVLISVTVPAMKGGPAGPGVRAAFTTTGEDWEASMAPTR